MTYQQHLNKTNTSTLSLWMLFNIFNFAINTLVYFTAVNSILQKLNNEDAMITVNECFFLCQLNWENAKKGHCCCY